MNWLDGVLLAIVAASVYYGARRGLVLEVFALVAIVVGAGAGIAYHDLVGGPLEGWVRHAGAARFLGFAVIFVVVGFAVLRLGRLVRAFVHTAFLGWVDALGGGVLGLAKGIFAAWAILTLGVAYLPPFQEASKDSSMAPSLLSASERAQALLPDELNGLMAARLEALREVWKAVEEK